MIKTKRHIDIKQDDILNNKVIIIHSVLDRESDKYKLDDTLIFNNNVLELSFDDAIPYDVKNIDDNFTLMSKKDVDKVHDFLKDGFDNLIVSCYGASGRSVAMAMFLSIVYDNGQYIKDNVENSDIMPNHYVFSKMYKYWGKGEIK